MQYRYLVSILRKSAKHAYTGEPDNTLRHTRDYNHIKYLHTHTLYSHTDSTQVRNWNKKTDTNTATTQQYK